MSFDHHVRFEETLPNEEAKEDYPEVPNGNPGAYSIKIKPNGEIQIIDRSGT